jgi:polygalacturonase
VNLKTIQLPLLTACSLLAIFSVTARTLHVRDLGAAGDGVTLDTAAIQAAIDRAAADGGGTVVLAGGRFLSGTIFLRSHVTLRIEAGATLLGSTNLADYPARVPKLRSYTDNYADQSLLYGEHLEHIGLVGDGVIDGQGGSFPRVRGELRYKNRPYVLRLVNCRDVLVEGLRMRNSAMWMQHYLACERVTLRGLHVSNFCNANNDALDLDGCRDVVVTQCIFESDDDALTVKSTLDRPTERVTISDCIARSHCNAIKLGTESTGGFRDITIANCVVTSPIGTTNVIYGRARGTSGISLQLVDGGQMERISIANVTIHGVTVPLFLRLGDRGRPFRADAPRPPIGTFRDVVINNIVATDVGGIGCSITGQPEQFIENVLLSNLTFTFEGGGERELADKVIPDLPEQYPECLMFGDLPAYGFYVRHARGVRFSNVQLRTTAPDLRHAMVFDNVENVALDGFDARYWPGAAAALKLTGARRVLIRGAQPRVADGTFLQVTGKDTRQVMLIGNDFRDTGRVANIGPEVPRRAVAVK